MKFKSIFVLFNAVVIVSFLFIFALPLFALGLNYSLQFWLSSWPLALMLLAILAVIDVFAILNWRLFELLEREDWPALTHYLEQRVVRKGRWSSRLVRLLANSYLVLSDSKSVIALEGKVAAAKPAILDRNALVFGVARILSNDHPQAVAFFNKRRLASRVESPEWVQWYYAFALLLNEEFSTAADVLVPLSQTAKDPLVVGLSAWFLSATLVKALPARESELAAATIAAKKRLLKKIPSRAAWDREVDRSKSEIHVVVLAKSINDAGSLLYA